MGRLLIYWPWETNGALLLFMTFDFWLFYWKIFWNICSMPSMMTELALVNVEILRGKFLSLTDSSWVGAWYKGPNCLMNSWILLYKMSSTMALLKPTVLDVGWFPRQSSSCRIMNGKFFAYVLSISVFLHQVLSVLLKIPDAYMFS